MESNRTKYILGFGHPILDITAVVDQAVLDQYGLLFGKTVFASDNNIGFFGHIQSTCSDVNYVPGGSVTNTIRTANWMLNRTSKDDAYKCMLLGAIGNDSDGKKISTFLENSGVIQVVEVKNEYKSSRCAVGIHLKERCMLPQIRASTMISKLFIQQSLNQLLLSDILVIEGFLVFPRTLGHVQILANAFRKNNKKIVLTLSSTSVIEKYYNELKDLADIANFIFCNHEEAHLFCNEGKDSDITDIEQISQKIHERLSPGLDRVIVITCGKKPVIISSYNYDAKAMEYLFKFSVCPVNPDDIVDTNGCGDAFLGGFLSQLIQNNTIQKCAEMVNIIFP